MLRGPPTARERRADVSVPVDHATPRVIVENEYVWQPRDTRFVAQRHAETVHQVRQLWVTELEADASGGPTDVIVSDPEGIR
jgi:hypothetical protein